MFSILLEGLGGISFGGEESGEVCSGLVGGLDTPMVTPLPIDDYGVCPSGADDATGL